MHMRRCRELESLTERLAVRDAEEDGAAEESGQDTPDSQPGTTQPVLAAPLQSADDLLVTAHADAAARAARAAVEMDAALAAMHDESAHDLAAVAEMRAVAFEDAVSKVEAVLRCAELQRSTRAAPPALPVGAAGVPWQLGAVGQPRCSAELRRDAEEDVEAARHFGHDAMVRSALAEAMARKMAPRLERSASGALRGRTRGPATLLLTAVLSGDKDGVRARRESFAAHRERTREAMLR